MKRFVILAALFLAACTSRDTATEAVSDMGFTDIEIIGTSVFGCKDDEFYGKEFKAKNAQGKEVNGVVCSSWFSSSVRLF
jgi:hypothetical protein